MARTGMVPRTRLLRRLAAEPRPRLVSVVAPPGYGKTVLLAEWAASDERPVAWLTLDDLDNDPGVFLSYLASSIDRVRPVDDSIRAAIAVSGQRVLGTAVPRLAVELDRWDRPGLLVLDDVHRLLDRTCLDALAELLEHLPASIQVAVAARAKPDLPFGRFRARHELLEIGPEDLALDEEETAAVASAAGRALARDEVRWLNDQTGGWAAGTYLAALARQDDAHLSAAGALSARDGYLAEYLRSELRRDLADEDLDLLARTSVLETVEPGVAEAIVGGVGIAQRLELLARRNLLISEVAGPGPSYRYHHLLREYLQAELGRREPDAARDLHRRAAHWYVAADRPNRAVDHAFASGDGDLAARLVGDWAQAVFFRGYGSVADRWLARFDDAALVRHPHLAVLAGLSHTLYGRAESAYRMLDLAERATDGGEIPRGWTSFESARATLRALMAPHGIERMLADATLGVATEGPGSPWRRTALWLLGSGHALQRRDDAAEEAFLRSIEAAGGAGAVSVASVGGLAILAMERGDWRTAGQHDREARALLTGSEFGEVVVALLVHAVAARVAAQQGDLAGARQHILRAQHVRPLASHATAWFSIQALLQLGRAHLAVSDPGGARSALRDAQDIVHRRSVALGRLTADLEELRRRVGEAAATLAGSSSLTAAELRLLPILSTYLSFEEIGERLGISRNTVKTQALSIYGKLQASSRSEAVERAVELGLLEPFPGFELTARRAPA